MTHRFLLTFWLALGLAAPPLGAAAQGQFSPAISIDGRVITNYEVDQRIKLLELFRSSPPAICPNRPATA
jgi:peptidyl-prolyl cis-trans isomerase SurA